MRNIFESTYSDWHKLVADYHKTFQAEDQWVFRGQEDAGWSLNTTLERLLRKHGIPAAHAPNYECQIIREFMRKARNYETGFSPSDVAECLSYIQHHGGPTRFVDWTYSFYVAAFFALCQASPTSKTAIWCFKSSAWNKTPTMKRFFGSKVMNAIAEDRAMKKGGTLDLMFGFPPLFADAISEAGAQVVRPCVYPINPRFLNRRLSYQQGLFLVQSQLSKTYKFNFESMLGSAEFDGCMRKLIIECSPKLLREALLDLRRMTITYESLFQHIDYFCRSLALGVVERYDLLRDADGVQLLRRKP